MSNSTDNPLTVLSQLLSPPQVHRASDGTLWPTMGLALLHDLLVTHWDRHLELVRDGSNLKLVRKQLLRVSQQDLAREVGVSQPFIALVEHGQKIVTAAMAKRIWGAFGRIANEQAAERARVEERIRQQITVRLEESHLVVTEKMDVCGG